MANITYQNLYEGLQSLQPPDASVPKTRMESAWQVRDMIVRAVQKDQTIRDWKRSRLKGLVDGNPPYQQSALIAAGRADECNVNWRIAKYFLTLAMGMLYDVFSQAETYATVTLDGYKLAETLGKIENGNFPTDSDATEWSRVITEEFDRLQRDDANFDTVNQLSQANSVLYGTGPMGFDDDLDWRMWQYESRHLLVPEMAKSNLEFWEWAALIVEYTPNKLYERIANPEIATSRGWNVAATRKAIMNAHPITRTGIMFQNWSWHQDMLKNGTFYYADQNKIVRCAHFYFKEFPEGQDEDGGITEVIIDLDTMAAVTENGQIDFLFRAPRRYKEWRDVIHPIYWQQDPNGMHHSITGLGIEMYAALEYENRLLCRLADDAFAPKLFFKPTTASERERMSIAQVGRYGILPAALDMVQQHVQPFLQDGLAMSREIQGLVSSNLSQYRSQSLQRVQGNPATATQINYEASEQAKMGATQLARLYEQWDWCYDAKYRRAINPKLTPAVRGGRQARDFVDRCVRRGVPEKALSCIASVKSTRAVGQGSAYLRQQALEFLLGMLGMLPEIGRQNLVRDVIAARAGQRFADRYAPRGQPQDPMLAAQQSDAMQQVAAMKTGVPPVPVPTQNPMIYAQTFLTAAQGAMDAVQQGADPHESLSFLKLAIPATQGHIQRLSQDKSREPAVKQMSEQLKGISSFADEVGNELARQQSQMAQAQAQAQAMQSGQDPDTVVGLAKVQSAHQIKAVKTQGDLVLKKQKQDADLALKAHAQAVTTALDDAQTAHGIRVDTAKAGHEMRVDAMKVGHEMSMNRIKTQAQAKNGKPAAK